MDFVLIGSCETQGLLSKNFAPNSKLKNNQAYIFLLISSYKTNDMAVQWWSFEGEGDI